VVARREAECDPSDGSDRDFRLERRWLSTQGEPPSVSCAYQHRACAAKRQRCAWMRTAGAAARARPTGRRVRINLTLCARARALATHDGAAHVLIALEIACHTTRDRT